MKGKRRALAIAVLFVFLLSPIGSSQMVGETRQEDVSLILRIAMQDDVKTLNPLVANDVWTHNVIDWLYDTPVRTDEDGKLVPYIAVGSANRSYSQNIDWDDLTVGNFGYSPKATWQNGTIPETTIFYDFTDVKWHDGTRMTIRDVLFSYHAAARLPTWDDNLMNLKDRGGKDGGNYSDTHWLNIYQAWESADRSQAALTFKLQTPFADFFTRTLSVTLLPYRIWGRTVSGQSMQNTLIWLDDGYVPGHDDAWSLNATQGYDNPDPVGSGIFKFDSWNKGVTTKIVTNRDHFYKEGFRYDVIDPETGRYRARQPTIEAVVFKIYKTAEQAVLALKNNEVDYIAWSIPPTFVQELMNEPDIGIKQSAEKGFFYLGYNMRLPSFGYDETGDDVAKPFRRAVAHTIDKQTIVQRLLQNFGIPGDGPVSSISTWYNNSIPGYAFDPQEAINILTEAGYQLTDGPGSTPGNGNWWLNPDGSPIGSAAGGKIEILTPPADYDPIHAQNGLMIASQMQNVGIYAESIAMDKGTILERIDARDFDMYISDWRIRSEPVDYFYAFFHSDTADAGQNYPGYRNESFDAIIDLARATGDAEERKQAIFDAQAAISYDLPYDILYFRTNIEAYRSDRFIGWLDDGSGTIFNKASIINLRPYDYYKEMTAKFINTASSVKSEGTIDVEVKVTLVEKNNDGSTERIVIPDARVYLEVTNGTLGLTNGTTDFNGKFRTTYTAPYVPAEGEPGYYPDFENGVNVLLQINTAQHDYYDDAPSKLNLVRVYPGDVEFLAVKMEAEPDVINDKDMAGTPGITNIEVTVTDQDDLPVEGADLVMLVDPAEPTITGSGTTDADGKATFTFTAADIDEGQEYLVSVLATKYGYKNGSQYIPVYVVDVNVIIGDPPPPETNYTPLVIVAILLPILLTTTVFLITRKPRSQS